MQTTLLLNEQSQVLYSARTFRRLLDSMAQPGKLNQLEYPAFLGEPQTAVNLFALGALQTLLDRETRAGLVDGGEWLPQEAPLWHWLALRCGADWSEPENAEFVMVCDSNSAGMLSHLNPGTLLEPENSATVFYPVDKLAKVVAPKEGRMVLELSGPGINGKRFLAVEGLSWDELKAIQATRQQYPLGLDIYLVDRNGLCAGLPRTTKISTQE